VPDRKQRDAPHVPPLDYDDLIESLFEKGEKQQAPNKSMPVRDARGPLSRRLPSKGRPQRQP